MLKKEIKKFTVSEKETIRTAIRKMDEGGIGFIACLDRKGTITGIVTDGDFRRAVLSGVELGNEISEIANRDFCFLEENFADRDAERIFEDTPFEYAPILKDGKLVDILVEEEFFKAAKKKVIKKPLDLPAVIMAGGRGRRLDPFTRVLPKALIPVGEKPLIEIIMDKFARSGVKDFYISVNHKAKMIKAYFEELKAKYSICFIDEDKPLGTAGALKFLEKKLASPFFVSNCDIIVDCNYSKLFEHHKRNKHDFTLVASSQHHTIPYGVCEIEKGGRLKEIIEKPKYDLLVNTGVYLLEPGVLKFIPRNKYFDITDLIKRLKKEGRVVGVYPVSETAWTDFGRWEEYHKNF